MPYLLITLGTPREAVYDLTIFFTIPLLLIATGYLFLLRKRNWLDLAAFIYAIYWLVKGGIHFYSGDVSEHDIFDAFGNVFAVIWFMSYIASKRTISVVIRDKKREVYATFLIIVGSFALFILFSIIYAMLAFSAEDRLLALLLK